VVEQASTNPESEISMIGALFPAEQKLIDHASVGTCCLLDGTSLDQRRVRAEIICGLLLENRWPVHPRGVRLCGAIIDEALDAEHTALNAPLVLERCELRAGFTFRSARATLIELLDCRIVGTPDASYLQAGSLRLHGSLITAYITLVGAVIDGDLDLEHLQVLGADVAGTAVLADQVRVGGGALLDRLETYGTVRLLGASIGGNLDLDGARLVGPDTALFADGVRVGGGVFLGKGLSAVGAIRLAGGRVDGQLSLAGGTIGGRDEAGNSLIGDGLHVGNDVFFNDGFSAAGAIRLVGATIGGNLEMQGAEVTGVDDYGDAVVAYSLTVQGDAFLQRLGSAGALRLTGATVGGRLSLAGMSVVDSDHDGYGIVADGLDVGSDAQLGDGLVTAGAVRVTGMVVGGNLEMNGARIKGTDGDGDALAARRLRVAGDMLVGEGFEAHGTVRLAQAVVEGQLALAPERSPPVVLTGARCGELADDPSCWPHEGELHLRGFRFGTLASSTGWRQRLSWIRRQGLVEWSPDPYEQLAGFYASAGDETAHRHVRIAKHDDELRHLRSTRQPGTLAYRFWRRPFGWLLGYGYRRHRAGWLLVAVLISAALVFRQAERDGGMVPDPAAATAATAQPPPPCGEDHPCFNAVIYGADVVLPVVDLGQDRAWRPIETEGHGPVWVWARWVFIAVGWTLASIFVAAFAGLVPLS
jgi:hypothetical protein